MLNHTGWFETGEHKFFYKLFKRHTVLQADGNRDGEIVHKTAEGGALLVHVDEDLAELAVLVFASVDIDPVPADSGLLDIALAAVGQLAAGAIPFAEVTATCR